jgi:hypothetical protein
MAHLAGYDVVFEISRLILQQAVYTATFDDQDPLDPTGKTTIVKSFTPPFSMHRTGAFLDDRLTLDLIVRSVSVAAQPGGPGVKLTLGFEKSSIQGSFGVASLLAGAIDVMCQMSATQPMDARFDQERTGTSFIAVDFSNNSVNVTFEDPSRATLASKIGDSKVDVLRVVMQLTLSNEFKNRGATPSGFGFHIASAGDSDGAQELTAPPDLSWIDAETLGVFGYYRAGARGGDVSLKMVSDRNPRELLGIVILISKDGFRSSIGRSVVGDLARDRVTGAKRPQLVDAERAKSGNVGPATKAEEDAAESKLRVYLDTQEGTQAIADNTPQPWAGGHLTDSVTLPDPFSDTSALTYWLDLGLGDGCIDVFTKSNASVFCGEARIEQHMKLALAVDKWSRIVPTMYKDQNPNVTLSADLVCKAAMIALSAFFLGPLAGCSTWFYRHRRSRCDRRRNEFSQQLIAWGSSSFLA